MSGNLGFFASSVVRGVPCKILLGFLLSAWALCVAGPLTSALPNQHGVGKPSASPQSQNLLPAKLADTRRTKIAEGEYVVYKEASEGEVGPFGEQVYDFHETWTLWRVGKGEYEVEGERRFQSPKDVPRVHRFVVRLARDMAVMNATEFTRLKWVPDSGPLVCDFLHQEMHCSSAAKGAKDEIDWHISVLGPYGLLWPISPFSLGGLTRECERYPDRPSRVSLVTIEQPSPDDPVAPTALVGELQYLGIESFEAAGQEWQAYKYSIKVPSIRDLSCGLLRKGCSWRSSQNINTPTGPKKGCGSSTTSNGPTSNLRLKRLASGHRRSEVLQGRHS
jgi:hypothetical protein